MEVLRDESRLMEIIREELLAVRDEYGDDRMTEIVESQEDLTTEDLITPQDMVVTLSNGGYAKTQPLSDYQAQRRGGRGKSASSVKEEDFIERLLIANTHDTILCFSNMGKVFWLRVFQIPMASRTARGRPVVNILPLEEGERITAMLQVSEFVEGKFILMATSNGTVKKTPLMAFSRRRSTGLIAIELESGNTLVDASITDGSKDIMLFSSGGRAIRFKESNVRAMGRTARGVRGIKLRASEKLISLIVPNVDGMLLLASENGFGKRTQVSHFSVIGRGGQGNVRVAVGAAEILGEGNHLRLQGVILHIQGLGHRGCSIVGGITTLDSRDLRGATTEHGHHITNDGRHRGIATGIGDTQPGTGRGRQGVGS